MEPEQYWQCTLCGAEGLNDVYLVLHFKLTHPAHWVVVCEDMNPRKPWLN